MIWIYRANSDNSNETIDHRLIFSPSNAVFTKLVNGVSNRLNLKPPIGVSDRSQLESINQKDFIAALDFHHSYVSSVQMIPIEKHN